MSEHTTVTVVIQGTELSFKTDDPGYIKELAAFVDGQMEKVALSDRVSAPVKAVMLTAFNIADELFRLRKEKSEMSEEFSKRLDTMLEMAEETYRSTRVAGDK